MNTILKIFRYQFRDVARSRWLILYALFFAIITELLVRFGGGTEKAVLSLSSLSLSIVPLVCIIFGTMYLYDARNFTELLLTQPVRRRDLFFGSYAAIAAPLAIAFAAGVGLPLLARFFFGGIAEVSGAVAVVAVGVVLTFIFSALAYFVVVRFEDRVRGLALAIFLWLLLAILYDGLVLLLVRWLTEYPLDKPMIAVMLVNPIDLGRVLILMMTDVSALMGYTGAVFERFFGTPLGATVAIGMLMLWVLVPVGAALRGFVRKDF